LRHLTTAPIARSADLLKVTSNIEHRNVLPFTPLNVVSPASAQIQQWQQLELGRRRPRPGRQWLLRRAPGL